MMPGPKATPLLSVDFGQRCSRAREWKNGGLIGRDDETQRRAEQEPRGDRTPKAARRCRLILGEMMTRWAREEGAPEGEITSIAHVGGVVGSFCGLGIGHAIQGRWMERGWIFTVGELVTFGMAAVASSESDLDTRTVTALAVVGWGGWLGLHGWEIVDAIRGPTAHNRRVRAARIKAAFAPAPAGTGATAGLALRF